MRFGRVERTAGRIGEPAIPDAAGRPAIGALVTGESNAQRGLPQCLAEFGDYFRWSVVQAVQDAEQAWADVLGPGARRGSAMSGESEEMITLIDREVQALCDGGDHLLRLLRSGLAFDTRVVVRRHVAERRHFFSPQSAGPAA